MLSSYEIFYRKFPVCSRLEFYAIVAHFLLARIFGDFFIEHSDDKLKHCVLLVAAYTKLVIHFLILFCCCK